MQKWLTGVAVGMSALALALSAWTFQQADARAEQALQRREKALVEKCKPEMQRFYKEINAKAPVDPQTLDELFEPLGKLLEPLSR